jgi:hypothetical protein
MAEPARAPTRYTVEQYFGLVHQDVLHADDRVELLDGIIVAMPPQNPPPFATAPPFGCNRR